MQITLQQAIGIFEAHREETIEAVSQAILKGPDDYMHRDSVTVALPFPHDFPCDEHMEDADDLFCHFIEAKYSVPRSNFIEIKVLTISIPIPADLK